MRRSQPCRQSGEGHSKEREQQELNPQGRKDLGLLKGQKAEGGREGLEGRAGPSRSCLGSWSLFSLHRKALGGSEQGRSMVLSMF